MIPLLGKIGGVGGGTWGSQWGSAEAAGHNQPGEKQPCQTEGKQSLNGFVFEQQVLCKHVYLFFSFIRDKTDSEIIIDTVWK